MDQAAVLNETRQTSEISQTAEVSRLHACRWWIAGAALILALAATAFSWPRIRVTKYLNTARQALKQGDSTAALPPLRSAARIQPRRAEVQYLLAVTHRRAGQLDRCRSCLQEARKLGWPIQDLERQNWLALAQAGEVDVVRDQLLKTIAAGAADEATEEIYEALAQGYLTAYRLRDAWRCLEMWLEWRPAAPQAHLMRAYIQEQMGQLPAAVEDYRAALDRLPNHTLGHVNIAELLLRQGAREEAETHFRACLAVAASGDEAAVVDAHIGVARCALGRGNADEARHALEAALALQPRPQQQAEALAEMGRLLLQEGSTQEALAQLQRAVQLAPAEIHIQRSLAAALTRAGRAEQAKVHFDRAREIEAKHNRVGEIQRALLEKPSDADLRCEAGQILIEQGLAVNGVGWLLTALKCNPNHRSSHQLLAEYYAAAGNQTLAAHHRLLAASAPQPK